MPHTTTELRTPRPGLALALLIVPVFMTAVDMTVLFLAMPEIAATLRPGPTQQLWILHVGDLLGAGLVLTAGVLAGRLGPRRLLALGLTAYGAASLLAAFAPNADVLIVARGLIGAAGVTLLPAAVAIARHLFTDEIGFARAVGLLMAAFSGGMAVGPPLGGLLLDAFWWGAIFLVNVPIAVAVLSLLPLVSAPSGRAAGRLDVLSVVLCLAGVGALVFSFQEVAAGGAPLPHLALAVGGVAVLVVFVRRQRTVPAPILPLHLLRSRQLLVALAAVVVAVVAGAAATMQIAQHLQLVTGLSAASAGLVLAVSAGAAFTSTALAPGLLRWVRPGPLIAGGALVATAGAAIVAVAVRDAGHDLWPVVVGAVLLEAGAGPLFGVGAGLIVSSAPPEHAGSATAVQDVGGNLASVLSLAVGGTIALLVYRMTMAAQSVPGITTAQQERASEGTGAALALVADLGGPQRQALEEAVQQSFAAATSTLYLGAAVLLAAVALVTWRGLRT